MRIGIDARMSGPNVRGGGLGRYVEQLVSELKAIDQQNRFVLFSPDIHWYTLKEQLFLAPLIDREKLDLVHFPHWNVPLGIKTPFVVTIHDLILLNEPRSARATTRHPLLFALKYHGFRRVLSHAVHASKKIIAVSQATKTDILKHFPDVRPEKVEVIYEGVTTLSAPAANTQRSLHAPYLLYVGNAYPHKNLETLIEAFAELHHSHPDLHLVFAGRKDVFQDRLRGVVEATSVSSFVHIESNPTDARLTQLYADAALYVFPSRIEGFGLPPLEAMQLGTPVAASDIPSLKEILGDAAAFFSPTDPYSIAATLDRLLENPSECEQLRRRGFEQVKKYSWKNMAQQTLHLYQSCVR